MAVIVGKWLNDNSDEINAKKDKNKCLKKTYSFFKKVQRPCKINCVKKVAKWWPKNVV